MRFTNFCTTCGAPLERKGWRRRIRGSNCRDCWLRNGRNVRFRSLVVVALMVTAAFGFGRYLRPSPPPLTIKRAANSPLPDLPLNLDELGKRNGRDSIQDSSSSNASADDKVYICGARTKKGTPCRRRVHFAGERCYQHKGMTAMVSLEKLAIKP